MKKQLLLLLLPWNLAAQEAVPQFIIPIAGNYLQDYYLVNYVDWSVSGIQDHACGNKTYDGHQGTDFVIRNFSQMDAGVDVYAAKSGVVTFIVDTLFDRNKTAVTGGLGNYVAIRHESDFYTYYGHLKKHSVTVQVGDTVAAGYKIGEVGSSGYTSDPHLHFEVWYDSLYYWDPFVGACGNPTTLMLDTLPYIDQFGLIDHDFTHFIPTLDTLKERLPAQHVFTAADAVISFWMQGYGVFPGDVSTLQWFDPEGNLWFQDEYVHPYEWWYYYWWTYINVPPDSKAGLWTVRYMINNEVKITDTFSLTKATSLAEYSEAFNASVIQQSNGDLIIEWPEKIAMDDELIIIDMLGKKIHSEKVGALSLNFTKISIPLHHTGFYMIYSQKGQLKPFRFYYVR
jgi:hypothetical protein